MFVCLFVAVITSVVTHVAFLFQSMSLLTILSPVSALLMLDDQSMTVSSRHKQSINYHQSGTSLLKLLLDEHPDVSTMFINDHRGTHGENEGAEFDWPLVDG